MNWVYNNIYHNIFYTFHRNYHNLALLLGFYKKLKYLYTPDTLSKPKFSFLKHANYLNSGKRNFKVVLRFKGTNGRQKTYEIFHVYCIFYSGFMCQTTVIFGITKDGSLVLTTLASWNCFTCRNIFQNGANDMSECLTCETAFCKKAQNYVKFGSSDFDQISPACGKHSY